MNLQEEIKKTVIDVPNFPKPGIIFKDITPIFANPELSKALIDHAVSLIKPLEVDVIVGLESRGFPLGFAIALAMNKPFVMIRKRGKLPRPTYQVSYDLEYGSAAMEIQIGDIQTGQRVYIHDDLLATGGTANAAAQLVQQSGGTLVGMGFLMELATLNGKENLTLYQVPLHTFAQL